MDGWQSFGVDLESGQPGLWRALAAVLHLGNVRVAAKEAASGTVAVLDAATLEQVGAPSSSSQTHLPSAYGQAKPALY